MENETREYQKVISYLSEMIASGELTVGQRLPTERHIAETLSIGRNSTREAMRMLEHMGMIVCKHGSGNYLTGNVSRSVSEMIHMMLLLGQTNRYEICSFRRNMEKAVCRAILDARTFSRWEEKESAILQRAQKTQQLEEQIELDRKFHFLLIHATENQFWTALLEPVADAYRKWIDVALQTASESVKQTLQQAHLDLFYALQKGDFSACEAAIDKHYNCVDAELQSLSMRNDPFYKTE